MLSPKNFEFKKFFKFENLLIFEIKEYEKFLEFQNLEN